jgi:6-phosphogluconolactonase
VERAAGDAVLMIGELRQVESVDALHAAGAETFASEAAQAVQARGSFNVALAGGSTPKGVYSLLATDARLRSQVAWNRVRFFWGDERHVPPDHAESNFRMAREAMLEPLGIDASRIWRMKGEYPIASKAADEYETALRAAFSLPAGQFPRFDLVLLGMGPDGHTASLFPGTDAVREQHRLAVANHVPRLATDRITLTAPVLNNAAAVVFLIHGGDKAQRLREVLEGPFDPERLPAQLVRPPAGRLVWLVDRSAAALLTSAKESEVRS